jgi:thioredoxin reductase
MKKTSIVIAGGGFAGLSAAMYLDKTLARRGVSDWAVTMKTRRAQLTPIAAPSPPEPAIRDRLK